MTTTDDIIARALAVLDAAEKMTPGPWKSRGVMIDPAIACIPHRPSMYTLGRTDESTPADDARADADAAGIATLRNDAPAVIRDLLARLADQARGLTVVDLTAAVDAYYARLGIKNFHTCPVCDPHAPGLGWVKEHDPRCAAGKHLRDRADGN